jgi:putative phage-type endonuclease
MIKINLNNEGKELLKSIKSLNKLNLNEDIVIKSDVNNFDVSEVSNPDVSEVENVTDIANVTDVDDLTDVENITDVADVCKYEISDKIKKFMNLPKYKQGSKEWLDQRLNYLTASTISAAIGANGQAARKGLLLNKASYGKLNNFTGNHATQHGNKFEPVANALYSLKNNNVTIHEFGMITNEKYPILGVSPDGILEDRMLEIKCPYSRIIDGNVKKEYYHQMQEQMAVCEYDMCDFLECKLEVLDETSFWYEYNSFKQEKGVIISVLNKEDESANISSANISSANIIYKYSDLNLNEDELHKWINDTLENEICFNMTFWKLSVYNCQSVYRDPDWIVRYYPILEQFWSEVVFLRENGISEDINNSPKEPLSPNSPSRNTSTSSLKKGICLI